METTSLSSLEHSLQNLSLRNRASKSMISTSSDDDTTTEDDTMDLNAGIELNSDIPLPSKWQQCLDLKTGEVYYRNEETGKKSRKDPRKAITKLWGGNYKSEEQEEEEDSYDSEQGSQSPSSSTSSSTATKRCDQVLVVAGCKSCLMYFMLPKYVVDCPKCSGIILHFDRFQNGSSIQ
ncbi:hypothetical protein MKW94_022350 [Papaver nudicaule]|uniref:WW domain-containing protein n=1 Tax=Papaver nudicaule TaxID=74823 RepID=A0AA41RVC4_PAPNU|nr:hypothetical protein [Papaver nudicaule]